MNLEPLSTDTLAATRQVAAELFPWEHEHQEALPASLDPMTHVGFYRSRDLESVRCWTAMEAGSVRGMATLYGYQARKEELWLAWFGLKSVQRGSGCGKKFLDWIVAQARDEGRKVLRLWTTDESEYAAAVRLYQKHGFVPELAPALPGETWKTWVFSLGLDGRVALPWALVPNHGELCGREAPAVNALAA